MTLEEIKQHYAFQRELNNRAYALFCYIRQKYFDLLDYWRNSCYKGFTLEENSICIVYSDKAYDSNDTTIIEFPLGDFCNNFEKAADDWANEVYKEKAEIKREEQKRQEDAEIALYKHLQAKYGK